MPRTKPEPEDLHCRSDGHDWYIYESVVERQSVNSEYNQTVVRQKRHCTRCGSDQPNRVVNYNTGELISPSNIKHSPHYDDLLHAHNISRPDARAMWAKIQDKRLKAEAPPNGKASRGKGRAKLRAVN